MTTRTYKIGNVKTAVICTITEGRWVTIVQGEDVIALSIDQAREIAAIIDEV